MAETKATVTGIPENVRALDRAGDLDLKAAGTEAARGLVPYLKSYTRTDTGRLRSAWDAEESALINETSYAGYQEFGTSSIEPTHALAKTMADHSDIVSEAFEKEQESAARKAGFGGL